ncbi:MAG: HAD family hydrolase [Defluviitaleaceae bacterium]|nr:HAD family hydrolase [Defluviitaleaceae bacterium]
MALKTIIFDMDGTLTATARATGLAVNALQAEYGFQTVTDARIRDAMGLGGLEFHAKLFPGVPSEVLEKIANDVDALEETNITKIGRDILFPGVRAMLDALAEKGHPLFIASTGSERHVNNTLKAAGITDMFTGIHCDEPQKVGMVKCIIKGRNPEGFAMVGDMYKDAEAAKGNAVLALGAGWGYLDDSEKDLFDAVLRNPEEIFFYL